MTVAERETLGSRIRALRQERGYSLRRLAGEIDLSPGYLSQLERGEAENPSKQVLEKVAEGLGVHVSRLLGEEPGQYSPNGKLPPALQDFLDEARTRGLAVSDADAQMLLAIRYRGRQPRTSGDWALLYDLIARIVK